jgi:hypothetical protein
MLKPKLCQRACKANAKSETTKKNKTKKEHRTHNITYTQAGVSCFVGKVSDKIKVQFFVGSSVVNIPACV